MPAATFPSDRNAGGLDLDRLKVPMRILQIIRDNETGDLKTLSETVANGLMERGATVDTAVMFAEHGTRAKLHGACRVAWQILTGHYDALIAYQASASIVAGVAGWFARCPHRIAHQTALPRTMRVPPRWLDGILGTLGFYTVNVANSRLISDAFAGYPAGYRRVTTTIEHGLPISRSRRTRDTTLARFSIPDDGAIVLTTARLESQRNQLVLIRALSHEPAARLVIAADGPLRDDYLATAHALGVLNRVHLLGDVTPKDVADLLAAADIFVCPATSETFGLLALEGAIAGLPIVASDLPILREVLSNDGESVAHFVSPHDPLAWARAIAAGPPVNPSKGWEIAQALAQRYSLTRMIDAYATLLDLPKQSKAARRQAASTAIAEAPPVTKTVAQSRSVRRRVTKARRQPSKSRQRASNE
jgi:glycosyltransferase involved in cell wall biosynthesis